MYTLNDFTSDINTALNYPAISFQDIKLYLNQAISELNSSLHISIRNINDIITENYKFTSAMENIVTLDHSPDTDDTVPMLSEDPTDGTTYYFNTITSEFRILTTVAQSETPVWRSYTSLYAQYIADGVRNIYKATFLNSAIYWLTEIYDNPLELDFSKYICNDWIQLFLIPYVCFKYSARDNDTGAIFSEEFTQGYQQLLIAYKIPDKVSLPKVAGTLPYTTDTEEHIGNLNVMCPTRAITEDMKIPRDIQATYGSCFDNGGW